MILRTFYSILAFLILGIHSLHAQTDSTNATPESRLSDNLFVEYTHFYGTIMDHRQTLGFLVRDNLTASQFGVYYRTYGTKYWHALFGYPEVGVSALYWDLRNPQHLGFIAGAYPMARMRMAGNQKSKLTVNVGAGLGYISKPFDEVNNYEFISLGSYLNGLYNISFSFNHWFNHNFGMTADMGITHLSNATFVSPNLGLNYLSVRLGLRYGLGTPNPVRKAEMPLTKKGVHFYMFTAYGTRQLHKPGGPNYNVISLIWQARKYFTQKHSMAAGFDFFYDGSVKPRLAEQNKTYSNLSQLTYGGMHLGYILNMGKLMVNLQQGVFVYSYFNQAGAVYQRLGLQYQVTDKWIANITFKTYFAYAEFIEWGVGYKIGSYGEKK